MDLSNTANFNEFRFLWFSIFLAHKKYWFPWEWIFGTGLWAKLYLALLENAIFNIPIGI